MTYKDALDYIHSTQKFGSKPGLTRIQALLDRFGNPERYLKVVHIAGTNGKGSTCAMTAGALQAAGYKTGLTISPFVEDFCERIQINREHIPRDALAALTEEAKAEISVIVDRGGIHPTEFELITATALVYFHRQGCDYAVLEVGLGGRLDATNVIPAPLVAAITSLSYDHTAYLGSTLESIAYEKCGILKSGSHAVTSAEQPDEAMNIITRQCEERNIPLQVPDMSELKILRSDLSGTDIVYRGLDYHISLLGEHQIKNAVTALEILEVLRRRGVSVPESAAKKALASAKWNGRLEIIRAKPLCITDAAHNTDAVRVLSNAIDKLLVGKRLITVMGMSQDKDYEACVPMLAQRSDCFVAVESGAYRALPAEDISRAAKGSCDNVYCFTDLKQGVSFACSQLSCEDVLLACGSLYMIGDAKRYILELT